MSSLILRATEISHRLLDAAVSKGDIVLDATAGNGHDTCYLAELVGDAGQVWAFDIQKAACRATAQALTQRGLLARARIICDDHANIAAYHIPPLACAIFNLGWLPGSDHSVVSGTSTVIALQAAFNIIKPGGVIVVVSYPGHEKGAWEYLAVQNWLSSFSDKEARSLKISYPAHEQAPVVLFIEKQYKKSKKP
ncbi:MAG: methyltransferase domain-containing protein [Clostridiales bacterium]|nr:methyltransferase domain-containing protein [Clostridiales bacterium]